MAALFPGRGWPGKTASLLGPAHEGPRCLPGISGCCWSSKLARAGAGLPPAPEAGEAVRGARGEVGTREGKAGPEAPAVIRASDAWPSMVS